MKRLLILIFTFFILFTQSFAFSDSNDFSWASEAINNWSSKGYVSGYPDGTFRGNNKITRAEVISIVNKLNNSDTKVMKKAGKDISINKWYFNDMVKAKEDGLLFLDENGNLRPEDYATREEVMVILSKLLNISYSGSLENAKVKSFYDSNEISSENYNRVAGIVEEGFVTGYVDNSLKPQNNITRAEFITMLNNIIDEIYTSGKYNNKLIKGNVVINGENVHMINSEIKGKVFVFDGARNAVPNFSNTKVSKGINSRVGNIFIEKEDEFKTLSQYNNEKTEDVNELVVAKISYSEEAWTNNDVKVKIKLNNNDYALIDGETTIKFKENGEKIIEFEYKGDIVKVKARVNNIDKTDPKITATYQVLGTNAIITTDIKDDGLSPIKSISCNSIKNKPDEETGIIEKIFTVTANGTYSIYAEDEAGNIGKTKITITGITTENVDSSVNSQNPLAPEITETPQTSTGIQTSENQQVTTQTPGNSETVNETIAL